MNKKEAQDTFSFLELVKKERSKILTEIYKICFEQTSPVILITFMFEYKGRNAIKLEYSSDPRVTLDELVKNIESKYEKVGIVSIEIFRDNAVFFAQEKSLSDIIKVTTLEFPVPGQCIVQPLTLKWKGV